MTKLPVLLLPARPQDLASPKKNVPQQILRPIMIIAESQGLI